MAKTKEMHSWARVEHALDMLADLLEAINRGAELAEQAGEPEGVFQGEVMDVIEKYSNTPVD